MEYLSANMGRESAIIGNGIGNETSHGVATAVARASHGSSRGGEMRDLSSDPLNDDPGNRRAIEQRNPTDLLQRSEAEDHRTELYARLRNIIDNATESIRGLKEENAALSGENAEMADRIGMLEHRIRAVTAELASDELELRKSAEVLEQVLRGAPIKAVEPTPASASPASADPMTDATAHDAPAMEPPASMPQAAEAETVPEAEAEPEAAMPVMEQAVTASMEETGPIPQPEPPPVALDEERSERVIAPLPASKANGTYTLIASPFVRFSDLGQFQAALQKLSGIHDVQVRRFAQGTLEMRVGYSGTTDLATTLRTLAAEIEDVREEEPYQLRVRLRTSQD
jgi:hypothetical protein